MRRAFGPRGRPKIPGVSLFNRTHPARRARTAVGLVGATTYVGLVWAIAGASESEATVNLAEAFAPTLDQFGQPVTNNLNLAGGAAPAAPLTDANPVQSPSTMVDGSPIVGAGGAAPVQPTDTAPGQVPNPTTAATAAPAGASTVAAGQQPAPSTQPPVTQPPATQPVATQPVATQPATTQPVATQPATTQPVATQPATTQPVATQPVATQAPVTQPPATQPPTTTSTGS